MQLVICPCASCLSFRPDKNRITRPVSKTVAVKATSYELLLMNGSHLTFSHGQCRSRMHVVNLREKRQTRKACDRDSPFSLSFACVSLMVASQSFMHGLRKLSQIFNVVDFQSVFQFFHHRGQFVHFHVRRLSSSLILPRTTLPPEFGSSSASTCICLMGCVTPCLSMTRFAEPIFETIVRSPVHRLSIWS